MRVSLLVAVAACGRIGFDPVGAGDAGTAVPGGLTTIAGAQRVELTGANGQGAAAVVFQNNVTIAGQAFTSPANASAIVARFASTGELAATSLLDSTSVCEARDIIMLGDTALEVGD